MNKLEVLLLLFGQNQVNGINQEQKQHLFAQEISQLDASLSPSEYLKLGLTPTVPINQAKNKENKTQEIKETKSFLMQQHNQQKVKKENVKKILTTAPPPIQAKEDFFKEVQELKGQHEEHEEKQQIDKLEKQHEFNEVKKQITNLEKQHIQKQNVDIKNKIEKAADWQIKKTLTTSPPPIKSKVDFYKQVQVLKGQHEAHEVQQQVQNLVQQHKLIEINQKQQQAIQQKILKAAEHEQKQLIQKQHVQSKIKEVKESQKLNNQRIEDEISQNELKQIHEDEVQNLIQKEHKSQSLKVKSRKAKKLQRIIKQMSQNRHADHMLQQDEFDDLRLDDSLPQEQPKSQVFTAQVMKHGQHQNQIPIEDFEENEEPVSTQKKSHKKSQNLHQRHKNHRAQQKDNEIIDNGGHKIMYRRQDLPDQYGNDGNNVDKRGRPLHTFDFVGPSAPHIGYDEGFEPHAPRAPIHYRREVTRNEGEHIENQPPSPHSPIHIRRGENNHHTRQDSVVIENGGNQVVYARDNELRNDHRGPHVINGRDSEGDKIYPHYKQETIISGEHDARQWQSPSYHKDQYLDDNEKHQHHVSRNDQHGGLQEPPVLHHKIRSHNGHRHHDYEATHKNEVESESRVPPVIRDQYQGAQRITIDPYASPVPRYQSDKEGMPFDTAPNGIPFEVRDAMSPKREDTMAPVSIKMPVNVKMFPSPIKAAAEMQREQEKQASPNPKPSEADDGKNQALTHTKVKSIIENTQQSKDIDTIMNNRDVDKKEIKQVLEKKLDKFDGFDAKFEDYAKQLKSEQPKIEKDSNVAKNEFVDEKLQQRIDKYHHLRDEVLKTSNEIEAAIAALHSERVVSSTGRWEIVNDNYQNQLPLNANLPRVTVHQPIAPASENNGASTVDTAQSDTKSIAQAPKAESPVQQIQSEDGTIDFIDKSPETPAMAKLIPVIKPQQTKSDVSFDVKQALKDEISKQDDGVVSGEKIENKFKPTSEKEIKESIEKTIEKNQEAIESAIAVEAKDLGSEIQTISIAQKKPQIQPPQSQQGKGKDFGVTVNVNTGTTTKYEKKTAKKAAKHEAQKLRKEANQEQRQLVPDYFKNLNIKQGNDIPKVKQASEDTPIADPKQIKREGEGLLIKNGIAPADRWANEPSLSQKKKPQAASTIAPPMNSHHVPGENKQFLASHSKSDNINYEKELAAQQEKDNQFHDQMEQEVKDQEKMDKQFKQQMQNEVNEQEGKAKDFKEDLKREVIQQEEKDKAIKDDIKRQFEAQQKKEQMTKEEMNLKVLQEQKTAEKAKIESSENLRVEQELKEVEKNELEQKEKEAIENKAELELKAKMEAEETEKKIKVEKQQQFIKAKEVAAEKARIEELNRSEKEKQMKEEIEKEEEEKKSKKAELKAKIEKEQNEFKLKMDKERIEHEQEDAQKISLIQEQKNLKLQKLEEQKQNKLEQLKKKQQAKILKAKEAEAENQRQEAEMEKVQKAELEKISMAAEEKAEQAAKAEKDRVAKIESEKSAKDQAEKFQAQRKAQQEKYEKLAKQKDEYEKFEKQAADVKSKKVNQDKIAQEITDKERANKLLAGQKAAEEEEERFEANQKVEKEAAATAAAEIVEKEKLAKIEYEKVTKMQQKRAEKIKVKQEQAATSEKAETQRLVDQKIKEEEKQESKMQAKHQKEIEEQEKFTDGQEDKVQSKVFKSIEAPTSPPVLTYEIDKNKKTQDKEDKDFDEPELDNMVQQKDHSKKKVEVTADKSPEQFIDEELKKAEADNEEEMSMM